MRLAGLILTALGLLIVLVAFNLDTSVPAYASATAAGAEAAADPGTNLLVAKLQRQTMFLHIGLAAILGGIMLFVGGEIARRLGTAAVPTGDAVSGEAPAAAAAAGEFRRPERALTRRDMLMGGGIVGTILIILFAFALFGRGGGGGGEDYTIVNALNASDSELLEVEEPDPEAANRARAAAAARRARVTEENRAAPETEPVDTQPAPADPAPTPANTAQPQLPPPDPVANGQ
jgi:hypothetical protein